MVYKGRKDVKRPGYERRIRLVLDLNVTLLQDEILPNNPHPHVMNVVDDGLEVAGGIVGVRDEDVVGLAVRRRRVQRRHGYEPCKNGVRTVWDESLKLLTHLS